MCSSIAGTSGQGKCIWAHSAAARARITKYRIYIANGHEDDKGRQEATMPDMKCKGALPTEETDVVLLCGGLGTRIRSVLGDTPKALAPIHKRPFILVLMDYIASFGFSNFILCVGYRGEAVESMFAAQPTSWHVEFSRETSPLGTGGALKGARHLTRSRDLLVMNGDSFCAVNLQKMLAFHRLKGAGITMAVAPIKCASEYGSVRIGEDDRILAFDEKRDDAKQGWVNAGIYVFSRAIVDSLIAQVPLSLERDVFPLLAGQSFFAFRSAERLYDIGTPDRYALAQRKISAIMRKTEIFRD